jgi:hypothetical protein
MAVVIYSEENGVYLGSAMGLGFWSKLDPIGQPAATTFDDEAQAQTHMDSWEGGRPADVRLVPVVADDGFYASIAACVRAGLPGWVDEETPVANALPV